MCQWKIGEGYKQAIWTKTHIILISHFRLCLVIQVYHVYKSKTINLLVFNLFNCKVDFNCKADYTYGVGKGAGKMGFLFTKLQNSSEA